MRPLLATVAGVLLALCMAGVAESQCGPDGCPTGMCPTQPRQQWQQPQWKRLPRTPIPAIQSRVPGFVCRMENQNAQTRRGLISECGTGALIYKDARVGGVLTCKHILKGGVGELTVTFPSVNQRYKARLIAVDPKQDLSYWTIKSPPVEPCRMASDYASAGDAITLLGLGQGSFRAQSGRVDGYRKTTTGNVFNLTGASRQGDSGGPVMNERGELTGVLWGTDKRITWATFIGDIHTFLCAERYAFPWNAKLADNKDARKQEANKPIVPERKKAPLPQFFGDWSSQQPVDLSGVNAAIADLRAGVKANEARFAPLEATADKARQLVEEWPELEERLQAVSNRASNADMSNLQAAGDMAKAKEDAADAKASIDAALDEDAPDGLIARARSRARETILNMGIVEKFGAGPLGIFGLLLAAAAWWIRRDIKDKAATGDPLTITKLRVKLAEMRGRAKAARDEEEYEEEDED